MTDFGYFKLRAAAPEVKIGDIEFNISRISDETFQAEKDGVECLVFPELSVTGYTCADLFQQKILLEKTENGIQNLMERLKDSPVLIAIGAPIRWAGSLYNCAIIIASGKILGIVPKTHIPNYSEFYEKRWFRSGKDLKNEEILFGNQKVAFGTDIIFSHKGVKIGVEICEDLWVPQPPSSNLCEAGADIILNLSASDETIGKHDYLVSLISQQSARCRCAYAYASAGWGESSTDLIFSGNAMIGYDGEVFGAQNRFNIGTVRETRWIDIEKLRLDRLKYNSFYDNSKSPARVRFIDSDVKTSQNQRASIPEETIIDPHPFVPENPATLEARCKEISNIQAYGLMKRLNAIGCKKAIVGISGGLDSTLALLVTVKAFDLLGLPREGIIAVTMPGLATTSRTKNNAINLMEELGVSILEIPIAEAVAVHFKDICQDPHNFDATYENSQARERTQILMDLANKENGIVIGTGDMSELALGWCTYNGDHMSMYGVNASVPKTLVRHLVNWHASRVSEATSAILLDIIDTPISPELVPSDSDEITQKTEDLVGPYELHDFYLYHFLRNSFSPEKIYQLACRAFEGKYDNKTIHKWLGIFLKRFFSQQFKRSCMPDGPKVGSVSLSPRGDWRMPSDASVALWIKEWENINLE